MQRSDSLASVRTRVQLFRRELRESPVELRQVEQAVVAEAVTAALLLQDRTPERSTRFEQHTACGFCEAQAAHQPGRALDVPSLAKLRDQLRAVFAIALVPGVAGAGVVRRIHPGRAAQRVHLDPAVVCQTRPTESSRVANGLDARVAFQRRRVLARRGNGLCHVVEPEHAHAERLENFPDFSQLVGIGRREHELHGREHDTSIGAKAAPMHAAEPRRPEILAPAGTDEAFVAALASGADALYLGLSEGFNARARSTAFDLQTLPELVRRAHRAGAKLYLTLNTLVFEDELEKLEDLLRGVVASGVDALIVQDPATAFLAQRLAPVLKLHASTQMTISSAEGAEFAATLDRKSVV